MPFEAPRSLVYRRRLTILAATWSLTDGERQSFSAALKNSIPVRHQRGHDLQTATFSALRAAPELPETIRRRRLQDAGLP